MQRSVTSISVCLCERRGGQCRNSDSWPRVISSPCPGQKFRDLLVFNLDARDKEDSLPIQLCFYNLWLKKSCHYTHLPTPSSGREWCPSDLRYFPFYLFTHLSLSWEMNILTHFNSTFWFMVLWLFRFWLMTPSTDHCVICPVLLSNSSYIAPSFYLTSRLCSLLWAWLYSPPPEDHRTIWWSYCQCPCSHEP